MAASPPPPRFLHNCPRSPWSQIAINNILLAQTCNFWTINAWNINVEYNLFGDRNEDVWPHTHTHTHTRSRYLFYMFTDTQGLFHKNKTKPHVTDFSNQIGTDWLLEERSVLKPLEVSPPEFHKDASSSPKNSYCRFIFSCRSWRSSRIESLTLECSLFSNLIKKMGFFYFELVNFIIIPMFWDGFNEYFS